MSYDIERKLIYTKEEPELLIEGLEPIPAVSESIFLNDLDEIEIVRIIHTEPTQIQHFKLDRILRDLVANAKWS